MGYERISHLRAFAARVAGHFRVSQADSDCGRRGAGAFAMLVDRFVAQGISREDAAGGGTDVSSGIPCGCRKDRRESVAGTVEDLGRDLPLRPAQPRTKPLHCRSGYRHAGIRNRSSTAIFQRDRQRAAERFPYKGAHAWCFLRFMIRPREEAGRQGYTSNKSRICRAEPRIRRAIIAASDDLRTLQTERRRGAV